LPAVGLFADPVETSGEWRHEIRAKIGVGNSIAVRNCGCHAAALWEASHNISVGDARRSQLRQYGRVVASSRDDTNLGQSHCALPTLPCKEWATRSRNSDERGLLPY